MQAEGKDLAPNEIRRVAERLALAYPYIEARKKAEGVLDDTPLESLIRGVLSQNTNDRNRDRAFAALRACYPTWEDVIDADVGELAEVIHATNHAYTKAGRIQVILREIKEARGTITLDFLRSWPTARILEYLTSFNGVGEKTAAIVCLFALKRPVMPVDTHVYRVTERLGWIGPRTTPARAHQVLQQLIPEQLIFALHTGLWEHGRITCRPHPKCGQCAVYAFCIYQAKTAPEPPVDVAIAMTADAERRAA